MRLKAPALWCLAALSVVAALSCSPHPRYDSRSTTLTLDWLRKDPSPAAANEALNRAEALEARGASTEAAALRTALAYRAADERDFPRARAHFERVTLQAPATPEDDRALWDYADRARYQAAVCLQAEGDKAGALSAYRAYLAEAVPGRYVHAVARRLSKLDPGSAEPDGRLVQRALDARSEHAKQAKSACGPLVVREALRRLHRPAPSVETVRQWCGTGGEGTTMAGMAAAFARAGVAAQGHRLNRADFARLSPPAVWLRGDHFVLILGVDGDRARVYDPNAGGESTVGLPPYSDGRFTADVLVLRVDRPASHASHSRLGVHP